MTVTVKRDLKRMKNKEVAEILERMGTLLEIKGEIVFKTRAYFKAAENIANLPEDIEVVCKESRLEEIPGIGKALAEKIAQYLTTGHMEAYQKLLQEIPESVLEVVGVPSVGPKKAKLFYEQLKVKSRDDLRKAAESGKLLGLEGIKEKTVENILRGIKVVCQGQERMDAATADDVAVRFMAALKKVPGVNRISTAGSLRRGCETVRDIDLLVEAACAREVMDTFVRLPEVQNILAHGETKSSILTRENVQVDLRVVDAQSFGAALLYFTGSKSFNIKLRQLALQKGMKVSEYGVFLTKGKAEERVAGTTEEACLKALGLPFIEAELREEIGEDDIFKGKKIPSLIDLKDIRGDFHAHSTWSDGHNTIEEMARAAMERGYHYLAVTDHSPRLRVAGGVSLEDLKRKKKEIDRLNKRMKGFHILFGTEVEIDMEGDLDYNNAVLSEFDIVIAAIHSGFEQSPRQLTQRLVKACQNKNVHIIAHPTGVHLGKREPCAIDLKEVCRAAVDHNVFLEINAFPIRLDLNSSNAYFARTMGVKFAINSDAHSVEHLGFMRFGVAVARRGWLKKEDVLNTFFYAKMVKALQK